MVLKCLVLVNVYKVENVNAGEQVVKRGQNLVNVVYVRPLRIKRSSPDNSCYKGLKSRP